MKKILVSIVTLLSVLSAAAGQYGDYPDSHPTLCKQYRSLASKECRGDSDCYTAELSHLVDLYNSQQEYSENAQDLYCNY